MSEYIVSWSAYGPSGRIHAESQEAATRFVEEQLWKLGLETVRYHQHAGMCDPLNLWDGHVIVIKSSVKRYGDMASFAVCVYAVGERSFYDEQRVVLDDQKIKEKHHAT